MPPPEKRGLIEQASISALTPVTRIGRIVEKAPEPGAEQLRLHDERGELLLLPSTGFDHFA